MIRQVASRKVLSSSITRKSMVSELVGGQTWQPYNECRSLARVAFAQKFAVHRPHQFPYDAQAQAGGGFTAGRPGGKPDITLEHFRPVLLREAGAFILDPAVHVGVRTGNADVDAFARLR